VRIKGITWQWIEVEPYTYSGSLTDRDLVEAVRKLRDLLEEHEAFKRWQVSLMKEQEEV